MNDGLSTLGDLRDDLLRKALLKQYKLQCRIKCLKAERDYWRHVAEIWRDEYETVAAFESPDSDRA